MECSAPEQMKKMVSEARVRGREEEEKEGKNVRDTQIQGWSLPGCKEDARMTCV